VKAFALCTSITNDEIHPENWGINVASHLKAYLFSKFQNLISKMRNLIFEPANLIFYFQGHELFFDVEELKTEFGRLNFLILEHCVLYFF
jgi:hypothetical protein